MNTFFCFIAAMYMLIFLTYYSKEINDIKEKYGFNFKAFIIGLFTFFMFWGISFLISW